MRCSESQSKIAPALVAALAEVTGVVKDSKNPHFKNDYASLENVVEAARPVLARHDLCAMQGPGELHGNALTVTTRIVHTSGEWIESDLQIPLGKADPQGAGSAITYARRYGLMAMLGMPALDDDGEAALGRGPTAGTVQIIPDRNGMGPSPEGPDFWGCTGSGTTAHQAKKDGLDVKHEDLRSELGKLTSAAEWKAWCAKNLPLIQSMPKAWRVILRDEAAEVAKELGVDFNAKRAA